MNVCKAFLDISIYYISWKWTTALYVSANVLNMVNSAVTYG